MAKLSFDEATKPQAEAPEKSLVARPSSTLAVPANYTDTGGFDGEFTNEDRQTPRLQIVAKTGALSNEFPPGNFVLNKQADLGKSPLKLVALRVKKLYQEVTDIEEGVMGRTFATAEEVRAAGLRVGLPTSKVVGEEAAPIMQILFFGALLFPVLGFFDVYFFRYSFVGDHFQYLASMGPLALLGAALARLPGLRLHSEELGDFDDTAALIAEMDLIVSVDTASAHLAGAMARPTWIMLPLPADWRWMAEREDNPWYPTVRLFRQPTAGDWDSAIARVAAALDALPA